MALLWIKSSTRSLFVAAFFLITLGLQSCATYQHKVQGARQAIVQGNYDLAAKELEPLALKESDDQLVYLLDYAVALQLAGRFQESVHALMKADELADIQDYHSVSRVAGSLLVNEGMVQYKGENFERLLINAFQAINFVMMNQMDSAMVEVRRLNEKLEKLRIDEEGRHEQNEFAQYLSALLWEADRRWDDAYIAYEKFYKLSPSFPLIKQDLIRTAKRSRRIDSLKKWQKEFPEVQLKEEWFDPGYGELVIIYQQGWGPKKRPNPANFRFPMLYPSPSHTAQAKILIQGEPVARTVEVHNISKIAVQTMNAHYASLIAKKIAAIGAKALVADQIRKNNQALGDLAWIAMNLADQADLRHWSTLPESFQIARVSLPAGSHQITIQGLDHFGVPTLERAEAIEIEIKPGKKVFYNWRTVR